MASAISNMTGMGRAVGCDYDRHHKHLIFVERNGRVSRLDMQTHSSTVIGRGYDHPEDVVVSGDGTFLYITERRGSLLKVRQAEADRDRAEEIAGGMLVPYLLSIDEEAGQAYVLEHGQPGRLLRVDLGTGAQTVLVEGLNAAIGLLMTADRRFAYISENVDRGDARVSRIEIATCRREVLMTDIRSPRYLSWVDEAELSQPADRKPAGIRRVVRDLLSSPDGEVVREAA